MGTGMPLGSVSIEADTPIRLLRGVGTPYYATILPLALVEYCSILTSALRTFEVTACAGLQESRP
jgi:hypothetical protein